MTEAQCECGVCRCKRDLAVALRERDEARGELAQFRAWVRYLHPDTAATLEKMGSKVLPGERKA